MEVMEGSATYTLTPALVGEVVAPGYKQTEVGVIPEDWRVTSLAALADVRSGGTPNTAQARFWDGDILWCTPTDITGLHGRKYLEDTARKITTLGLRSSSAEIIPPQSVVMTSRATIGECAINRVSLATNQGFKNFIPHDDVEVEFLYYLLLTQRQGFVSLCGGSTFLEIGKRQLASYTVSFPPSKAEQEAIAEALSDADVLINALQQLIAKKRAIKQGAMQELLTGQTRLPGFHGEWEIKRLEDVAEIVSGGTPRTNEPSYWNGGIKWCTPTDITRYSGKYLSETERTISRDGLGDSGATLLPVGALLLCSRATIGEIKIAGSPICTNQGFKSLVCHPQVCTEFLYYKLLTMKQKMVERAFGSTFLEISTRNVSALEVATPSYEEQIAIAAVLSDMDAELSALEARRDKTRALKQGMMQVLLTGRIRLT